MNKSITNRQLFIILTMILFTEPTIYLPRFMAKSAGIGSWLPLLLDAVVFGIAAVLYIKLNSLYKGKMLFEYSSEIIGKFLAYVLGILFVFYFLTISAYLLASFTNTLKNNFLPETPAWFEMLFAIPVFGYAAAKGVTSIARMAEIVGFIFLFTAIWVHIAMTLQGNAQNILPLYNPYELGKYLGAMKDAAIPFLGIELLAIIPFTLDKPKKTMKTAFFAVLVCGLLFILIVLSTFIMVGTEEVQNYTDPTIAAIRQVEIPAVEFLMRIDAFYLTVGFSGLFIFIIIEYCAVVEFISKLLPKAKRTHIVIAAGIVLFILGNIATGIDDLRDKFASYAVYIIPVVSIVIPLVLLILAKVKKNA